MKSTIDLINKRFNSLRESEKRVAKFIQKHTGEVVILSLQGLAKKCHTSDATVLRFCRSLGYFGFLDFKAALVPELLRQEHKIYQDVDPDLNSDSKKNVFLGNFHQQLDLSLNNCDFKAVKIIAERIAYADKILIVGIGGSAGVAHIFRDSLGSLGIYSTCPLDRSVVQNLIPILTEQDILVCISHSGETEEVIKAANIAEQQGIFTIGITNFSPSPLADIAGVSLITSVPENLLGGYSCQARISQLAVLEMVLYELSNILAKKRSADSVAM